MNASLSFAEVCDYYQAVVYDRTLLVDEIARLLPASDGARILDCACGTGLPAIDLRGGGFDIACSDGDDQMLRQFRRNAEARNVHDNCVFARWSDLPKTLPYQYDYVMCRGNSFVYAVSWSAVEQPAATYAQLLESLRGIAAQVISGGTLHIDLPAEASLAKATYPEIEVKGMPVKVTEQVVVHGSGRTWHQDVTIGDENYSYTTNSAVIGLETVCGMLRSLGFHNIRPLVLVAERPSYQILLAQKG